MGIWNYIFKYNDYIKNIESLNESDDLEIYDEYKKSASKVKILAEGLIMTHPNNKSLDIILRRFKELSGNIEPDGEIFLHGQFLEINKYIPLFRNLGYIISKYTIDGNKWLKDFIDTTKPIALYLEAIYDMEISPIPYILYHVSPKNFKEKIEKIGLIPKSGSKLSNHPARIYLTDNLNLAKNFGNSQLNSDFIICQINTDGLDMKLYSDVNLRSNGYYTLSNIPPSNITIL